MLEQFDQPAPRGRIYRHQRHQVQIDFLGFERLEQIRDRGGERLGVRRIEFEFAIDQAVFTIFAQFNVVECCNTVATSAVAAIATAINLSEFFKAQTLTIKFFVIVHAGIAATATAEGAIAIVTAIAGRNGT